MKIAITGSMASGKSTCSNIIRDYGYYVLIVIYMQKPVMKKNI